MSNNTFSPSHNDHERRHQVQRHNTYTSNTITRNLSLQNISKEMLTSWLTCSVNCNRDVKVFSAWRQHFTNSLHTFSFKIHSPHTCTGNLSVFITCKSDDTKYYLEFDETFIKSVPQETFNIQCPIVKFVF